MSQGASPLRIPAVCDSKNGIKTFNISFMKPQFAVLHLLKPEKDDKGGIKLSAHIERTITPANADSRRTHLNRELIAFPEGIQNRTDAITHRIDTASIKRKISDNQCRFIAVMLSGSPEQMKKLERDGKLDAWCEDNLKWLRDTFGEKNLVSAVLHMDEKTPHIHATIVPIVQGERRKAKQEEQNGKKKYRKKNPQSSRLCADDVMARNKLSSYQDSYAKAMNKYGLERGIVGSEAKHITTMQYYKELKKEQVSIQENIKQLSQKEDKLKKSVRGLTLKDSVLGLLGAGKVRTLEENNENLTQSVSDLKKEFQSELKRTEQRHRQEMATMQAKHGQEIMGYQDLIRRAEGFLKMPLPEFCKKAGERLRKSLAERKAQTLPRVEPRGRRM